MKVQKVVSEKITKVMVERNISVKKLASITCLTQSAVDSLVNGKSKNLNSLVRK